MAKSKKGGKAVQKKGKLMLNNPLIPPDLDEDVDDDLAFNSDDEKMYGHFFNKSEGDASYADDNRNHLSDDDDDNDDEEVDLMGMMDENMAKESKKVKEPKAGKRKRQREEIREAESMYGVTGKDTDGVLPTYSKALNHFMAKNKKNEAEENAFHRLESTLLNKKNTLVTEEDEGTQAKLDREQVRRVVKENMTKYNAVMREMNTAKRVVFPLHQPDSNPITTTVGSASSTAEQTLLKGAGSSVAQKLALRSSSLLASAGLYAPSSDEGGVVMGPGLGDVTSLLPTEEEGDMDVPSSGYIAKLRSMMATENSRRKRFNKIKSKTYRRILRKEKDREAEKRQKAFELLHPELARKRLSEKLMKARAEERVTQKHKNTSAWVKHAKRFAKFNTDSQQSIEEQHLLHQRLMQKMDDEAGEAYFATHDVSNDGSEDDERLVDDLVQNVSSEDRKKNLVASLWKDDASAVPSSEPFAKARAEMKEMKFMKSATERKMKVMREELDALTDELRAQGEDTEMQRDSSGDIKRRSKMASAKKKDHVEQIHLVHSSGTHCVKSAIDSSAHPKSKVQSDSEFANPNPTKSIQSSRKVMKPEVSFPEEEKPTNQTAGLENITQVENSVLKDQSYLVSRAFAGDEIDEEFLQKKESQVDNIIEPIDPNAALPGWGEWGGENPNLNKRHKAKLEHQAIEKGIEKSFLLKSRADASLDHVIINHDGVELVPDRMTLHMVPRPFSNPQEFARSMRQPVGPEWSSSIAFKDGVDPRVEVQQGHAVVPLDLSNVPKKNKTKRRKK